MGAKPQVKSKGTAGYTVEIFVFDDGSDFEWLSEVAGDFPSLHFNKCASFEDLDVYLHKIEGRILPLPDLLAIDVHCSQYENFELLGVDVPLEENKCGFQLYEHVLRPSSPAMQKLPTLFFTSYPAGVRSLETARLAKAYGDHLTSCSRESFRDSLTQLCVAKDWLSAEEVARAAGPNQDDYIELFARLAAEFQFGPEEQCAFLGVVSRDAADVPLILRSTLMANERIDALLAISVLLDQYVKSNSKRSYLLHTHSDEKRLGDLLTGGLHEDLLRLKAALEARLGGAIL